MQGPACSGWGADRQRTSTGRPGTGLGSTAGSGDGAGSDAGKHGDACVCVQQLLLAGVGGWRAQGVCRQAARAAGWCGIFTVVLDVSVEMHWVCRDSGGAAGGKVPGVSVGRFTLRAYAASVGGLQALKRELAKQTFLHWRAVSSTTFQGVVQRASPVSTASLAAGLAHSTAAACLAAPVAAPTRHGGVGVPGARPPEADAVELQCPLAASSLVRVFRPLCALCVGGLRVTGRQPSRRPRQARPAPRAAHEAQRTEVGPAPREVRVLVARPAARPGAGLPGEVGGLRGQAALQGQPCRRPALWGPRRPLQGRPVTGPCELCNMRPSIVRRPWPLHPQARQTRPRRLRNLQRLKGWPTAQLEGLASR